MKLKKIEVIKDEIESYNDSPAELIFDDFEELIFHSNTMSHNVLGIERKFRQVHFWKGKDFLSSILFPEHGFSCGNVNADKNCSIGWKVFWFSIRRDAGK